MRIPSAFARLTAILSLLGAVSAAHASDSWRVTSWTTDDALPQGSVYAIRQTADGYLWFTTLGGLVRYDGVEFTVFAKATTPGLRSSRFTALFEARDGTLWAGTEDGFVTRYQGGAFKSWSVDGTLAPVYAISAEGASLPWAVTENGLFTFDGARFIRAGPALRHRRYFFTGGSVAVDESGVRVLRPGRPPRLLPFEGMLALRTLVTADDAILWIFDGEAIFLFDGATLKRLDQPALASLIRSGAGIRAFTQTRDGAFWISVPGRGIARVEGDSIDWINPGDRLFEAGVDRIYEDREGTIWVTDFSGGISSIQRRPARTHGEAAGLLPPIAYPILPHDGELLVGSWGGGVYRFDGQRFQPSLPSTGWVMSLADGGEGTLWVGTYMSGVRRVRGADVHLFTVAQGLPAPIVPAIHRASDGTVWFGTTNGLSTIGADDRFTTYRMPSPAANYIQTIVEDRDHSLLLGTRGGLVRFRDGRGSVVADERSGMSSDSIRAIHLDPDGTTWLGTYDGGLNRLRNGRVSSITTKQGLFDNGVFAILEDSGFFWMSSNRGIYRVSRRELNAVADGKIKTVASLALTKSDGLLSPECNGGVQPAAARTPDGLLWFPTQKGIVSVDPRLVPADRPPPPISMTGISIDGEAAPGSGEIRVEPGSRRLEFRFAAPTTVASRLIRYRYKLEGFDSDWNEIVGERVAAYTSIPPGRYRFLVSASSSAGRWNERPASAELRVLPPFWRTWWFTAAALAAGALLLWTAYRVRMNALRKEQAAQVEFSRRLLMQQEEERKWVAGELHDSLGQNLLIIKNRALMGLDQQAADAATEQFAEISETASSAIEEVRRIAHNLRPVELDHLGLTKSLEVLLRRMSASSPILFSGDLEPVDRLLTKEAEVSVFRIVQEWLSNVARHSSANAAVVSLRRENGRLRLRIQDDGAGFSRAQASREQRLGIGLRSIAERVRMLGGRYDIRSTPGEGTSMTIELPLSEEP